MHEMFEINLLPIYHVYAITYLNKFIFLENQFSKKNLPNTIYTLYIPKKKKKNSVSYFIFKKNFVINLKSLKNS